jgi:hypothetical protein
MNVKVFRLLTGDDMIAEVTKEEDNKLTLKNPMLIGVSDQGLITAPLSLIAKTEEVTISSDHVLFMAAPEDEILNHYKKQFGGIVLPSSGIALP